MHVQCDLAGDSDHSQIDVGTLFRVDISQVSSATVHTTKPKKRNMMIVYLECFSITKLIRTSKLVMLYLLT